MIYSRAEAAEAIATIAMYRSGIDGEIGAALAVVGLSAERADREAEFRDEMIRVAHRPAHRCARSRKPQASTARR